MKLKFLSPLCLSHISTLLRRHKIKKTTHKGDALLGRALPEARRVLIPTISCWISYAVALHEIGHIVTNAPGQTDLESEFISWQWAEKNASFWCYEMSKTRAKCLRSHLKNNKTKCAGRKSILESIQVY